MKQTVQEIISKIDKLVNPEWKFEMDDIFFDRGGIPYPPIESLSTLFWKRNGKGLRSVSILTKEKENELITMINDTVPELHSVKISRIQSFGCYIVVELNSINNELIYKYNKYLEFKENNLDKIEKIYEQMEGQIPKDFIGFDLFNNK